MIDHVSVGVSDLDRAARFYETTLAPLGLTRLVTRPATVGFGTSFPEFWINFRAGMTEVTPDSGGHSDGAPGLRPHDRVRYYAAFVRDPDGNRIEAVTFLTDAAPS